jgi:site-specific DNA-methyltransferase (adenine-specific)
MDYLRDCPDKHFDLACVDPPYGIGESGGNDSRNRFACVSYQRKDWDYCAPGTEYFRELVRVSKHQIIWGANHFAGRLTKPDSPCWLVWDKENGGSDFADCELAWTSYPSAVRLFRYRWAGMLQANMANKEIRIHPTQKPVALYRWILEHYAHQCDRILDTHLGSGSSAIAAHYFGCDFVGIELDPDYFAAAKARFDAETRQIDLLGGVS